MAIHPKFGSGFFIGSVFTTLPLPPDEPLKRDTYCGSCDKCQVACPTGALSQDRSYILDARRCIRWVREKGWGRIARRRGTSQT